MSETCCRTLEILGLHLKFGLSLLDELPYGRALSSSLSSSAALDRYLFRFSYGLSKLERNKINEPPNATRTTKAIEAKEIEEVTPFMLAISSHPSRSTPQLKARMVGDLFRKSNHWLA